MYIYLYYGRIIDKNCVVLLAHVWLQEGKTEIWVLSLWSYINCGVSHKKLRFEQQYSQYVDIGKTIFLGAWKWSFTLQRKQPSNNGKNWFASGDNGSFQFLGEPWIQFAKCWFMCVYHRQWQWSFVFLWLSVTQTDRTFSKKWKNSMTTIQNFTLCYIIQHSYGRALL